MSWYIGVRAMADYGRYDLVKLIIYSDLIVFNFSFIYLN